MIHDVVCQCRVIEDHPVTAIFFHHEVGRVKYPYTREKCYIHNNKSGVHNSYSEKI